jgi:cob(I)alamin adenosyltransferase
MKIYTKTGDKGQTALFGGKRVSKSDLRVDAYGTVDELNSFIGFLADNLSNEPQKALLKNIQERLFTLGANLASDPAKHPPIPDILGSDIELLEVEIDKMESILPALQNFILPGGHPAVSVCHLCRTVCRRAERLVVALHKKDPIDALILQYLNRLSDYFFVLSRMIGHELQVPENIWRPRTK